MLSKYKKGKGFAPILIVLVFAGLLATSFIAYKKLQPIQKPLQTTPSQQLSPTPPPAGEPTADWKTYKNDEVGIEFKYPSEYVLEAKKDYSFIFSLLLKGKENNITIEIADNKQPLPQLDGTETVEEIEESMDKKTYAKAELITIDNITAVRYYSTDTYKMYFLQDQTVLLYRGNLVFFFSLHHDEKSNSNDKYFDQILSTFQFTN